MAFEVILRWKQRGVEEFDERVYLVSVELHRCGGQEQHAPRQVIRRSKIAHQVV